MVSSGERVLTWKNTDSRRDTDYDVGVILGLQMGLRHGGIVVLSPFYCDTIAAFGGKRGTSWDLSR